MISEKSRKEPKARKTRKREGFEQKWGGKEALLSEYYFVDVEDREQDKKGHNI